MIEHEQYYRKGGTYELPIEIYNDLIGQIEDAQKERDIYKSRCEKANKWVDKHTEIYTKNGISIIDWDNLSDPRKLKNILNGSDEK